MWSLATLKAGLPQFASLRPYIKDAKNIEDIATFIRVTLRDVVDEKTLIQLREKWQGNLIVSEMTVMVDSGVETGVDIARYLALGAEAVFAGRAFLYGAAAHGEKGAEHSIDLLKDELEQVMSQVHCNKPAFMHQHLE